MKTRDFITKAIEGSTKSRSCSSVFSEGNGTEKAAVYSYGYHYPLIFKVGGKLVRNVSGYSPSTGRHILWSRDLEAIDIHAGGNFRLSYDDAQNMVELQNAQQYYIRELRAKMDGKKRKDTAIFRDLENQLHYAIEQLNALQA